MTTTPDPATSDTTSEGYSTALSNRQVQMIAMGGAIGVGLFLGAGGKLADIGPGLLLSYAVCGLAAFFVMRALGELVLHRPVAGSFVTYAREFIGPWAGFAAGWLYWLNWVGSGVAEITAAGVYVSKWFPAFPQWLTALICLAGLLVVNLLSVRLFGELEFWFSAIKVLAIVSFLVVGLGFVLGGFDVGGTPAGPSHLLQGGGLFPHGVPIALMGLQGVVFAFASIEMVGIAAGETREPEKVMPKAINSVVWRIAVFYLGSIALLAMLLPWSSYSGGESPFVTVFSSIGIPWAGDVMNFIVLTAALSACNSGLYATARILRSLAERREAPAVTARMNRRHVPYGGVLFTGGVFLLGVVLNYFVPQEAFEVATSIASLGVLSTWAVLLVAQLTLRRRARRGEVRRPSYRMPGSPWSNWITLGFFAVVLVLAAFSEDVAVRSSIYAIPAIVVVLAIGWRFVRRHSLAARAHEHADAAARSQPPAEEQVATRTGSVSP